MAEYSQVRPLASMQVPIQARLDLRDGMSRWLPHARSEGPWRDEGASIDATVLLDFCLHHRVSYVGGDPKLASKWDRVAKRDHLPRFSELQDGGWVLFDGVRWVHPRVPVGMLGGVAYPDEATKSFLQGLSDRKLVAAGRPVTKQAKAMAADAKAGSLQIHDLGGQKDGRWVASKLWEGLCPASDEATFAEVDDAFRHWTAWCDALRIFAEWDSNWSAVAKTRCRAAAQRVLSRQQVWGPWGRDVERYVSIMTGAFGLSPDQFPSFNGNFGATLVTRVDWVDSPAISRLNAERFRGASAGFAFGLLLSELTRSDVIGIKAEAATFVSRFVADHPVAMFNMSLAVSGAPVLLVDLLLQPPTACLAVRWIAEWIPSGSAWERGLSDQRSEQTQAFAIQDALSVLAYEIRRNNLDLEEFAALVTWCFSAGLDSSKGKTAPKRLSMGKLLVSMVADQTDGIQQKLFGLLVRQASVNSHVRFGIFGAVVEAVSVMPNLRLADGAGAVELYIGMARSFQLDRTDTGALSPPLAAAFVAIAAAQPVGVRDDFIRPVDPVSVLNAAAPENAVSTRSGLASTLRPHIRMLARAVAGWPQPVVPEFLARALVQLTRQAVVDHAERGKVAALGDGYSAFRFFWSERGSPGADLATAWHRLDEAGRDELLTALELAEDPVLLANTTLQLPDAARSRLRARLLRLVPDEASTVWTWTEAANRVAALIEAKELDLALLHLGQAEAKVDGAPVDVQQRLFALKLQLLIERHAWPDLDALAVPASLSGPDKDRAQQHLDFSRATAQLLRADGDVETAFSTLSRLAARSRAPAYKENAVAAAIRLLERAQEQLSAQEFQARINLLLAEIDVEVAARREQGIDSDGMVENRASLLLASRRPQEALEALATIRHKGASSNAELLAAVASDHLGLHEEARKILDRALQKFGQQERLVQAKEELIQQATGEQDAEAPSEQEGVQAPAVREQEATLTTPAPVVTVGIENPDPSRLLSQMRSMAAEDVGSLFSDKGLNGYLLNEVSGALSALQQLASILREPPEPDSARRPEDDLTALVGKVLSAGLSFVGWQVAEQSPGGVIRKRNMGKRDLAIKDNSNREISIYEALVCRGSPDMADMWEHLQRLVGYAQVKVSFHVTYAYKNIDKVKKAIDRLIEAKPPDGMNLVTVDPVPHYGTPGSIATYTLGHRTLWVVFLVIDLGLVSERQAVASETPSFLKK